MGSPENTPGTSRRDRIEEMRRAERSRDRRGRVAIVAVSAVVVAALAGGGVWLVTKDDGGAEASKGAKGSDKADAKPAAPPGHFSYAKDGVGTWSGKLGRDHVATEVTYPMKPPVGGDHNQAWMNCDGDVYDQALPDVNAVHSLEHGAVWVTYNDKAAKADVRALAKKVEQTPYSLMSPVDDQKDPVMLSAWGHQRTVKGASDPAVTAFFSTFVQGKQTPEQGAPCTGGLTK